MPLLANRAAQLAGRLITRAAAVDAKKTGDLLIDFNVKQAGRIIAANAAYADDLRQAYEAPHGLHSLDAYLTLTEGVLRPYGSLLVRLAEISGGRGSETFTPFKTLGALDDALGLLTDDLVALARLGLVSALRNHRAHENAFRDPVGKIVAVDADGRQVEIEVGDVRWGCIIVRSFLDGIDTSANVLLPLLGISASSTTQQRPNVSLDLCEVMMGVLACRFTDGTLKRLTTDGTTATLCITGRIEKGQAEVLAAAARPYLPPSLIRISIVRPDGTICYQHGPTPLGEHASASGDPVPKQSD